VSNFNSHESFDFNDTTQRTASVENQPHYGVEKVTHQSESGSEVTITGGDSINGILNNDLSRATENNPVTFPATPASSSPLSDYYVHGRQIKYRVTTNVSPGTILGSVSVDNETKNNQNTDIVEGSTHSVVATPNSPCTFQNWTGDYDEFSVPTDTGNSKTIPNTLDDDMTVTANFNCVVNVEDPTGAVIQNPTSCSWSKIQNMYVNENGNCCNLVKYTLGPQEILLAQNNCNKSFLNVYSAYYKPIPQPKCYSYVYHARGWAGDVGSSHPSACYVAPQFGLNTTDSQTGLPVGNYAMMIPTSNSGRKPCDPVQDETLCNDPCYIVNTIPTISSNVGYSKPIDVYRYYTRCTENNVTYSCLSDNNHPEWENDGRPDVEIFLGTASSTNVFSWGNYAISENSTNSIGKWMVSNSAIADFPRSTWLVICPQSGGYHFDPSRFDISDVDTITYQSQTITNVNELLDTTKSGLSSNQAVWFELEVKEIPITSVPANSDFLQTYYDNSDDIVWGDQNDGTLITQINGNYISRDWPNTIRICLSNGNSTYYNKIVYRDMLFRKNCNGGTIGPNGIEEIQNMTSTNTFFFQDGECGSFNGWANGNGTIIESDNILNLSVPSSCCNTYHPEVESCSDKYYPYGFRIVNGGTVKYYRCAILPYCDNSTGNFLTPPNGSTIITSLDINTIITEGLVQNGNIVGLDNVFFALTPNRTLYFNGLMLLKFDNTQNWEYYTTDGDSRELTTTSTASGIPLSETGKLTNETNNSTHYYRIAYMEIEDTIGQDSYISNYAAIDDAFLSGEIFLYADDSDYDEEMYNGLKVKYGVVYKNNCGINKSAVLLSCFDGVDGDELTLKMSLESRYIDYGVTRDVETDATNTLYRYVKRYEPLVDSPNNYDYGEKSNMVSWSDIGDGRVNDYTIFGLRSFVERNPLPFGSQYIYKYNLFDGYDFGFEQEKRVFVSEKIWEKQTTQDPDIPWQYVKVNNTTSCTDGNNTYYNYDQNDGDNSNARSCNMQEGLFLLAHDNNSESIVLLTNSNLSYYTNPSYYTFPTDIDYVCSNAPTTSYCEGPQLAGYNYVLEDGGIGTRFEIDSTQTYELGHYCYGTDSNSFTYGRWWPLNYDEIIDECSFYNLDTYHLINSNQTSYTGTRKYILIKNINGLDQASYYDFVNNLWVDYDAFPCLIDCTAMGVNDELIILREIDDLGECTADESYYVIINEGYTDINREKHDTICHVANYFYANKKYVTQSGFEDIMNDSDITLCLRVAYVTSETKGILVYVDGQYVSNVYEGDANGDVAEATISGGYFNSGTIDSYSFFKGSDCITNGGTYNSPYTLFTADELIDAWEREIRFVKIGENIPYDVKPFNSNTPPYVKNSVYRLNVDKISETSSSSFYTEAHNFWNTSTHSYNAKESGSEIELSFENGDIMIPVRWNNSNIVSIKEYYCSKDGFDGNGLYIGIPELQSGTTYYKPQCYTLSGAQESGSWKGVFRNLSCDCCSNLVHTGYGFMPMETSTSGTYDYCAYKREISYNQELGIYEITKYGYYANDIFIEVPENGIKWLRLSDDGVHVSIVNNIIDGISVEKLNTGMYELTPPLEKVGNVLQKDYYDYILFNGTPSSASSDVSTTSQLETHRDTNHTLFIHTTTNVHAPITNLPNQQGAARTYPSGKYWELISNYYYETSVNGSQNPYRFQFLGWLVEDKPVYKYYCDSNCNGITGRVKFPIRNSFEENSDNSLTYESIYSIYPDVSYPFNLVNTNVESYRVVRNVVELDECLKSAVLFKVDSYDANDITGMDGNTYYNGYFYEPNPSLLTTAIKNMYPYIETDDIVMDYMGKQYNANSTYSNTGVRSIIFTQDDVKRVFNRDVEYAMIADYVLYDEYPSESIDVYTIDDLKNAISNKAEYINVQANIIYRYMKYESGHYYQYNKITINGTQYNGGDVFKREIGYRFFPRDEKVRVMGCQTATAIYAHNFFLTFCSSAYGFGCGVTTDGMSGMQFSYDDSLLYGLASGLNDPEVFYIDHRHFTGSHRLSYTLIDTIENENGDIIEAGDSFNSNCQNMNGYNVGKCSRETFTGEHVEMDIDKINDIKTFVDGILPYCNQSLTMSGSCESLIVTNNQESLFGLEEYDYSDPQTGNENYPDFYYLKYIGVNYPLTWYEWNGSQYNMVDTENDPDWVEPSDAAAVYTIPVRWENGSYPLKRLISVGVYKVVVEKYYDDPGDIAPYNINQYTSLFGYSWYEDNPIAAFAPYIRTSDVADTENLQRIFLRDSALPFVFEANTCYSIQYTKINDISERLENTENSLQLFLVVYDRDMVPARFGSNVYVWMGTQTPPTVTPPYSISNVSNETEYVDAVMSGVDIIHVQTDFEMGGHEYLTGAYYGSSVKFSPCNFAIFGYCTNPILRYITGDEITLEAPIVTIIDNSVSVGDSYYVTMTHSNSPDPSIQILYSITVQGVSDANPSTIYTGPLTISKSVLDGHQINARCHGGYGYNNSTITVETPPV